MEYKSKGNYLSFAVDASKDLSLIEKFFREYQKKGEKPEKLLKFFVNRGYDGVSLEDCEKLLAFLNQFHGKPPWDFDISKY